MESFDSGTKYTMNANTMKVKATTITNSSALTIGPIPNTSLHHVGEENQVNKLNEKVPPSEYPNEHHQENF
jgi:hypothetical protein